LALHLESLGHLLDGVGTHLASGCTSASNQKPGKDGQAQGQRTA